MASSPNNFTKILKDLFDALQKLFQRQKATPEKKIEIVKKVETIKVEVKVVETITTEVVTEPVSKGFMVCPIQGKDPKGNPLTPSTVEICSVVDHSGTAIDPDSKNGWGVSAKDQKVKAFNGEIGDGQSSADKPYGYMKKTPVPFFANKEINYVGTRADGSRANHYLNYDGHAGYDFPYPKLTPVLATAKGRLKKAAVGEDPTYNASWNKDHSFYIIHENGYISWYRHCEKLAEKIEVAILNDFSKEYLVEQGALVAYVGNVGTVPIHLHLELLNDKKKIVDPYGEKLWIQ